jgi:hypothetical protein
MANNYDNEIHHLDDKGNDSTSCGEDNHDYGSKDLLTLEVIWLKKGVVIIALFKFWNAMQRVPLSNFSHGTVSLFSATSKKQL